MDGNFSFLGLIAAALPGVLVALLAQYLTQRREDQQARRLDLNARKLLALEIESNRGALRDFWQEVNRLDTENGATTEAHLAGMAAHGLIGYSGPLWATVRWDGFPPRSYGALGADEVAALDQFYRDLLTIRDLYTKLTTFTPDEHRYYFESGGSSARFWNLRFGEDRAKLFERLQQVADRVANGPQPLQKQHP
jgi:hypothetical protein